MKSPFATLAALALAATSALAQQLTVNTPFNPVVCQPVLISWSGGTPPYFLLLFSIFDGNQPNGQALFDFGEVKGNSLTWKVNFQAGRSIGLTIRDSTGASAQSAPFSINGGTDTSCVGQNPVTSAGPSGAGNTSGGSTPAATNTSPATTGGSTPTTSAGGNTSTTPRPGTSAPGTNTSTSTRPSSTNAAPTQAPGFGAAAVIGAAAVALFA
ncbi:putative secreted protein [Lyophyllum shimeji]|uniref:Secreted protein n=1 Tax=Lyophyllum shimeji TaxID=47721 RepID=A0A9P3PS86_LYOSH|nr:putative secreted protein [Lyophyllum shimeji]